MTPIGTPELVSLLVALGGMTAAAAWAVIELRSREDECRMIPFHRAAEKGALAYPISCNLALACGDEMQFNQLKRREFITLLGGMAAAWPLAARAQQGSTPPFDARSCRLEPRENPFHPHVAENVAMRGTHDR